MLYKAVLRDLQRILQRIKIGLIDSHLIAGERRWLVRP